MRGPRTIQEIAQWIPPKPGAIKINVDASVIPGMDSFSVRMVLRNGRGEFCKARITRLYGEVTVLEAEPQGMLQALRWITELGIKNVELECDSMIAVQAINRGTKNLFKVGNIFQDCRIISSNRPDVTIQYVKIKPTKWLTS
ncbi:uncharacterized protein LOC141695888 [Apium graveolens]|uniref:uncharacterized protein LOC141695888 n=1 Tax=Apium graveolens TaxID=4045 RepID=UPI003D7BA385